MAVDLKKKFLATGAAVSLVGSIFSSSQVAWGMKLDTDKLEVKKDNDVESIETYSGNHVINLKWDIIEFCDIFLDENSFEYKNVAMYPKDFGGVESEKKGFYELDKNKDCLLEYLNRQNSYIYEQFVCGGKNPKEVENKEKQKKYCIVDLYVRLCSENVILKLLTDDANKSEFYYTSLDRNFIVSDKYFYFPRIFSSKDANTPISSQFNSDDVAKKTIENLKELEKFVLELDKLLKKVEKNKHFSCACGSEGCFFEGVKEDFLFELLKSCFSENCNSYRLSDVDGNGKGKIKIDKGKFVVEDFEGNALVKSDDKLDYMFDAFRYWLKESFFYEYKKLFLEWNDFDYRDATRYKVRYYGTRVLAFLVLGLVGVHCFNKLRNSSKVIVDTGTMVSTGNGEVGSGGDVYLYSIVGGGAVFAALAECFRRFFVGNPFKGTKLAKAEGTEIGAIGMEDDGSGLSGAKNNA